MPWLGSVGSLCSNACQWGTDAVQNVSHGISSGISSMGHHLRFNCLTRTVLQKPLRAFVFTASTASIVASSIFLNRAMQEEEPDPTVLTAYSLNLGLSTRLLLESLFPSVHGTRMRVVQDKLAGWAFATYETMLQLMDNFPAAEQQLLNTLIAIIGYHAAGDTLTLWYSQGQPLLEHYRRSGYANLEEMDINDDLHHPEQVVSHLLQPDYDRLKQICVLNTAIGVAGAASVLFGEFNLAQRASLTPFFQAVGYFLIGQGGGYLSMEGLRHWLKKMEQSEPDSFKIKALHKFFDFTPALAVEIISAISSSHPGVFAVVGWLYGMRHNETLRRFQILTPEAYREKIEQNQIFNEQEGRRVKTLANRINEWATLGFFAAFTGWFVYGAYGNIPKEKVTLSLFIASTLLSALGAKVADAYFQPGQNGRAFNQLNYTLFDNSLFISVAYMFMKEMTAISDQAINQDTGVLLVFGNMGVCLFGIALGSELIGNLRLVLEPYKLTGPSFHMLSLQALIKRNK